MTPRAPFLDLAIAGLALLTASAGACYSGPRVVEGADARGVAGFEGAPPRPALETPSDVAGAPDGVGAADRPAFQFEPTELMVYRATAVHFRFEARPAGHEAAECHWQFGDGTPTVAGCLVSHTFQGGTADQPVTLTLRDGDWSVSTTRIVPLERLPVTAGIAEPEAGPARIPEPPAPGPTNLRAVLLADSAGQADPSLATHIARLKPDLVVHLGGAVAPGEGEAGWAAVRDMLAEPLRAAHIPLLWGLSPADFEAGAEVRRPLKGAGDDQLELADGSSFPERWALAFRGTYLVFISGTEQSNGALDWLRARLAEAQIYESRIVFSYLPLHPFTARALPVLAPKFKVYELLLRARASALVTAGHRAYFKGRYGALPVVSVGAALGAGETLAGASAPQGPSIVVMDVEEGVPTRIFALTGASFNEPFDEHELPETVEVYTR